MTEEAPGPETPAPGEPSTRPGDPEGRPYMAPPSAEVPSGESSLFTWGSGGAVLAGCVGLLVSVLLGLVEAPSGDATRFTVRDLAFLVGLGGLLSFGVAAFAWRGRALDLFVAAAVHALLAGAFFYAGGKALGGVPKVFLAVVAVHGLASLLAFAAGVAGDPAAPSLHPRAFFAGRHGAENLESILVAIVFALVIRHFAVEAYKIPTESMSPTLLGDSARRGPGDRVLVAKWPALLGGPERYQVWVFRPPLDRTINYVKRVAGLPGESVEIEDGDLYVDGKVSRKPPRTREEMWFGVWPRPDGQAETKLPWESEGFRKDGDAFTVKGAAKRALVTYEGQAHDTRGNDVGDVRLRCSVEDAEPGTVFVVRITGRAGACEARIAADGSLVETQSGGRKASHRPGGPAVRDLEVSFADLLLEVRADGKVVSVMECEPLAARGRPSYGIAFGVDRGGATFRGVRLDRDVFYTGSHRFQVPEGRYLFLGDNSANSQDARMWRAWEIRETAPGGRVFYAESKPYGLDKDGRFTFKDRNQVVRSYLPAEVSVADSSTPMSFVPAEDLHGRAFAIFWPPRWFTQAPGGRVGFLP